jgi:hypothetical protein
MSPSDPLQFDLYKRQLEHREGLRRDIELHVEPLIHQATDADKAAIELGQSILKTGTLLNGGALVAIPAVIALFGIDAKAVTPNLLIAAGLFVIGLLLSWLSGIGGFFTLSRRSDRDYQHAEATKATLYRDCYPDKTKRAKQTDQIEQQSRLVKRHHRAFVIYRIFTILFSFLSLAAFVAGTVFGGLTILHAPSR